MTNKVKKDIFQNLHDFCSKVETENFINKSDKERIINYIKEVETLCAKEFKYYALNIVSMTILNIIAFQKEMFVTSLILPTINYFIVKKAFKNTKETTEICLKTREIIENIGEKI